MIGALNIILICGGIILVARGLCLSEKDPILVGTLAVAIGIWVT